MANASQKRIAAENAKTLRTLRIGFLVSNLVHILVRLVLFRSSLTYTLLFAYVASTGIAVVLWRQLEAMGTPRFDARGALISAGDDLAQEGLTAYMFDIVYVTWFVHVATAILSDKFWWIYLVIPAYASYVLYTKIIRPYLLPNGISGLLGGGRGRAAAEESSSSGEPGLSKRQQKLQKRADKGDPRVQRREGRR